MKKCIFQMSCINRLPVGLYPLLLFFYMQNIQDEYQLYVQSSFYIHFRFLFNEATSQTNVKTSKVGAILGA